MKKTEQMKKELEQLEKKLAEHIHKIGMSEAIKKSGLKQSDISAWIHRKRNWSHEKVINIYEKVIEKR